METAMEQAIACNRGPSVMDEARRARHRLAIEHVERAVLSIERVSGGFALRYQADDSSIVKLAEFITHERLCCPFLDFELRLAAGADQVELRLTGGPEVQGFLEAEITSRGSSPANTAETHAP